MIWKLRIIVLLTAGINAIVVDVRTGIRIGIKLILVCNITYIFSKVTSYTELAEALEKIFSIFKFIKINPKSVSLMICIAIAFIPTISKQIKQMKDTLKSKGVKLRIKNCGLIFEPVIISLLKRVDEIESALKSKGYAEADIWCILWYNINMFTYDYQSQTCKTGRVWLNWVIQWLYYSENIYGKKDKSDVLKNKEELFMGSCFVITGKWIYLSKIL